MGLAMYSRINITFTYLGKNVGYAELGEEDLEGLGRPSTLTKRKERRAKQNVLTSAKESKEHEIP